MNTIVAMKNALWTNVKAFFRGLHYKRLFWNMAKFGVIVSATIWLGLQLIWTAIVAMSPSFLGFVFISGVTINYAFGTLLAIIAVSGIIMYRLNKRWSLPRLLK